MPSPRPPEPPDSGATPPATSGVSPWTLWGVLLLCLGVTLGLWWQVQNQLADLQAGQAQLAADLATMQNIPTLDVSETPALGADDAVVTLVEFSDYECPFCLRHFTQTMPRLTAEYIETGRLRYVFRDFPIDQLHPGAKLAHQAAQCADEQGRFWDLHDRLFTEPGSHDRAALERTAADAGLELEAFGACLESGRYVDEIEASVSRAYALGAQGTPFFLIGVRDPATDQVEILNGVSGAQPFEVFADAIESAEARVR